MLLTMNEDYGMPPEEHLENQESMELVGHINEKEHVELEVAETV